MDRVASLGHTDVLLSNEKWGLRGSNSRVARYALENGALDHIDEDEFYSELSLGPRSLVRLVSVNDMVALPSMKHGHRDLKTDMSIVALSTVEVMSGWRHEDEVKRYCRALGIAGLQSVEKNGAVLYNAVLEKIRETKNGIRDLSSRVHGMLEACPLGMDCKVLRVIQRLIKHGHTEDALVPLFLCYHTLAPGECIFVSRCERCAFVCGEAMVIRLEGAIGRYPKEMYSFRPTSTSTLLLEGWFRETVCYPGKLCVLEPLGPRKTMIVVIEGEGVIDSSRPCRTGQCFLQSENSVQISVPPLNRGYLKLICVPMR